MGRQSTMLLTYVMLGELAQLDRARLHYVGERLVDGREHGQRDRVETDEFPHAVELAELGELLVQRACPGYFGYTCVRRQAGQVC